MDNMALGHLFDDSDKLFNGFNNTFACLVACNALNRLGVIAALIDASGSTADLAGRCEVPADKLARLLDFLAAHEIIVRDADGIYHATARTAVLHEAAPYLQNGENTLSAGTHLHEALQQGDVTAFQLHFGQPVFEYFGDNPEAAARFGGFMGWMTGRMLRFLFAEHRFRPFGTIADIGGSMGDLLLAMLGEYPGTEGILFDLPEVVELARPKVAASPHADRVKITGGSFFVSVPPADLYTLKQILHDWNDEQCVAILCTIRDAIKPGGRLAVIDHIVSQTPTPDEAQATDIVMMLWDTGRERKQADFEQLFAASGFRLDRITRNPRGHSVIEAVPV